MTGPRFGLPAGSPTVSVGDFFADALHKDVVERRFDDGARAGGALLAAEAEGRGDDAVDGCIEIGVGADEDGVFAAHLEDGALDPDLAGLGFGGALVDVEADGLGAGEGDEARLGVLDDRVAEGGAGAGAEVDDAAGHAGFFEHFNELGGDGGRVAGGLEDDGVAGDDGGRGHAGHDGEGEVPRRNDGADAERNIEQAVALAGVLDGRGGGGEAQGFAGVELEEVDGLGDVGVGLGPVLADFVGEPGAELELALADDVRRR